MVWTWAEWQVLFSVRATIWIVIQEAVCGQPFSHHDCSEGREKVASLGSIWSEACRHFLVRIKHEARPPGDFVKQGTKQCHVILQTPRSLFLTKFIVVFISLLQLFLLELLFHR